MFSTISKRLDTMTGRVAGFSPFEPLPVVAVYRATCDSSRRRPRWFALGKGSADNV